MIDALCESNINSVYNKIYTQNIINGGIKGNRMEYIKNPMKIEEKSFELIQEIIDEIRPDYKFKNNIEEK